MIVPIYKVEAFAEDCIKSIMSQTYTNLEIILVLGKTEDSCEKICKTYADLDERIQVLTCEPKGLSDARNRGIEIAKGAYIGFVDGDDWIEPDMYEKLLHVLLENKADISVCGRFIEYADGNRAAIGGENRTYCLTPQEGIEAILYMKDILTSAWDKLYKAELFDGIRYPLGRALEDLFTTYKLFDKAQKIAVTSQKEYHYRVRKGSLLNTYNVKNQMDADDVLIEVEDFVKKRYPSLMPAVNSIYVRTYFACLRHNLESGELNQKYAKQAVKNIRSRAWKVIWDKKSTLMAKVVSVVGSLGIPVSRFILIIFDHREKNAY